MGEAKKRREEMKMRKWGDETIGLAQGTPSPLEIRRSEKTADDDADDEAMRRGRTTQATNRKEDDDEEL